MRQFVSRENARSREERTKKAPARRQGPRNATLRVLRCPEAMI